MKKTFFLAVLSALSMAGAQQLSPVYQQHFQAAVKVQDKGDVVESLRLILSNLDGGYNKADAASRAYVCSEYVRAYLAAHPEQASKPAGAGDFRGTFAELQAYCAGKLTQNLAQLPDADTAARALTDISISRLLTEGGEQDGSNKTKIEDIVKDQADGLLSDKFVENLVQMDLLLNKYPDLRGQSLSTSSRAIGTGAAVLKTSQALLVEASKVWAQIGQDNAAQASAGQKADEDGNIKIVVDGYTRAQANFARGDAAAKKGDYEEASKQYYFAAEPFAAYKTSQQELLGLNINRQVTVGGKTLSFSDLVKATYALAATAKARAEAANVAKAKQDEQRRQAWASAANASLRGDRLAAYKLAGIPTELDGGFVPGPNYIKESVDRMVKSGTWTYGLYQRRNPESYTCRVIYTFSGNKLVRSSVTASPAYTGYVADCQARYTLR